MSKKSLSSAVSWPRSGGGSSGTNGRPAISRGREEGLVAQAAIGRDRRAVGAVLVSALLSSRIQGVVACDRDRCAMPGGWIRIARRTVGRESAVAARQRRASRRNRTGKDLFPPDNARYSGLHCSRSAASTPYNLPSTTSAGNTCLTSKNMAPGRPRARSRSIPIALNWRWATARMMAS